LPDFLLYNFHAISNTVKIVLAIFSFVISIVSIVLWWKKLQNDNTKRGSWIAQNAGRRVCFEAKDLK